MQSCRDRILLAAAFDYTVREEPIARTYSWRVRHAEARRRAPLAGALAGLRRPAHLYRCRGGRHADRRWTASARTKPASARPFWSRLSALDQIRAQIYLSGTYVRDFLLSPDP